MRNKRLIKQWKIVRWSVTTLNGGGALCIPVAQPLMHQISLCRKGLTSQEHFKQVAGNSIGLFFYCDWFKAIFSGGLCKYIFLYQCWSGVSSFLFKKMQSSYEALAQLKWKSDDAVDAQPRSLPFFQSHTAGICLPGCSLSFQNPCLLKLYRRCLYTQTNTILLEVRH